MRIKTSGTKMLIKNSRIGENIVVSIKRLSRRPGGDMTLIKLRDECFLMRGQALVELPVELVGIAAFM
jgi:hypothetical protein